MVERFRAAGAAVDVVPLGERSRTLHRHEVAGSGRGPARRSTRSATRPGSPRRIRRLRPGPRAHHLAEERAVRRDGRSARPRPGGLVHPGPDRARLPARLGREDGADGVTGGAERDHRQLGGDRLDRCPVGGSPSTSCTRPCRCCRRHRRGPRRRSGSGSVGRLSAWKGQHVFLDAFAKAFAGTDARGPPDRRPALRRGGVRGRAPRAGGAARPGRPRRVPRPPRRRRRGAGRRSTSSCTASTVPEPFGQVVVEAMGVGRPVIAAAAGGPLEIVTDGIDGLLTPPGDADALAAAMTRLADDPDLGGRLVAAARAKAPRFAPEARRRGDAGRLRPGAAPPARRGERRRSVGDRRPLGEVLGLDRAAPRPRALQRHQRGRVDRSTRSSRPSTGRRRPRCSGAPRIGWSSPPCRTRPTSRAAPSTSSSSRTASTGLDARPRRDRAHRPLDRAAAPPRALLPREVSAPPAPGRRARAARRGDAARRGLPLPRDRDRAEPARRRVLGLAAVPLPAGAVPVGVGRDLREPRGRRRASYGDRFVQLRYEDLVTGPTDLFDRVADLVGVPASTWEDRGGLHGGSLRRWSTDPAFGFSLHPDVVRSARSLRLRRGRAAQPAGQPDVAVPPRGAPGAAPAAHALTKPTRGAAPPVRDRCRVTVISLRRRS